MKNKLRLNTVTLLVNQVISVIVGLIIPRLILLHYGSAVNGLNYSISQMLSIISYFDLGISAVAQAALYAPLDKNDYTTISKVYCAIKKYFNILTIVLCIYIVALCFYYGIFKADQYSWQYTTTLILAVAVSNVGLYIWGVSNQVLLAADQRIYKYTIINIISQIANALLTYILIEYDCSIQIVKLVSSIVFLMRPLFLQLYVKKKYRIVKIKNASLDYLPNKWSGLIQHLATTLTSSLDTIVLTLASSLTRISIYNVYTFPLNGIRVLIESVSGGYKSFFGHALVRENDIEINKEFQQFEMIIHLLDTVFFCTAFKLLMPFVRIYTHGVSDTNYQVGTFAFVILLAYFIMILRVPYTTIINAAGHFKQTQGYCIIEVVINIVLSFALVKQLDIVGVAVGTVAAVGYRIIASVLYLRFNILHRRIFPFIKNILIDFICFIFFFVITKFIDLKSNNLFECGILALIYVIVSFILYLCASYIIDKKNTVIVVNQLLVHRIKIK